MPNDPDPKLSVLELIRVIETQIVTLQKQVKILRNAIQSPNVVAYEAPSERATAPPAARSLPDAVVKAKPVQEGPKSGGENLSRLEKAKAMLCKLWEGEESPEPCMFNGIIQFAVKHGFAEGSARKYFGVLVREGLIEKDQDDKKLRYWIPTKAGMDLIKNGI